MVMTDQSRHATVPASWADPAASLRPAAPWWRRALPLASWLGCLLLAVGLLLALGDGRLAAPVLTDPSGWAAWAAGRDPLEVAMVVLRLLALALAWYLLGVTSVSVVARVLRAARLVQLADALSMGPVKVLVQQAVGVGLAAGVLAVAVPGVPGATRTSAAHHPAASADAATVVAAAVTDSVGPTSAALPAAATPSADVGVSAVPVPAPAPAPAHERATSPPPRPAGSDQDGAAGVEQPDPREIRIAPGDHFWAIAEQDLAEHLGRPATDLEVVAHWEAILEANADRLEVPGNPDLLLPGQLVVLPPVSGVQP